MRPHGRSELDKEAIVLVYEHSLASGCPLPKHHMKIHLAIATALCLLTFSAHAETQIPNRLIDYSAFLNNAQQVKAVRESRRLTEDQFLQAMSERGVVLLDARSAAKFKLRHLRGAVNLSLPDFTAAELAKIIPSRDTKVLIYCNNNFLGSDGAFPSKAPGASLNISTYVTLTTYGYTNVYELGSLIDVKTSKLPFEGDEVSK
jgi:phage shock protein E